MGAQGRIDKHGALETLGRRPRVSVAFVPKAAARQRASRLAGLVWFPVSWPTQTEARDAQRGGPPLESPCRQLSLVLSFASKESTSPPRCGSPTVRAGVGASVPPARDSLTAKLPCVAISRGLFARPLHSFGSPTETPKHPVPRRSRRVMLHPWASGMRLRAHKRAFRSPFGNLRIPKLARNP